MRSCVSAGVRRKGERGWGTKDFIEIHNHPLRVLSLTGGMVVWPPVATAVGLLEWVQGCSCDEQVQVAVWP